MGWSNRRGFVAASATAVLTTTVGCSTTATITRMDGIRQDARFAGSDRKSIYLATARGTERLSRSEVSDIDHPGDTAAVIGGLLAAYGLVNIQVGSKKCEVEGTAYCMGVYLPAAVGFPMLIWGIGVHVTSVKALHREPESTAEEQAVTVMPALLVTDHGDKALGIRGHF